MRVLAVRAVLLLPALCAAALAACATAPRADYDPEVSFAGWTQWAWREPARAEPAFKYDSELVGRRVHRAAAEALGARGMREVPAGEARFFVTYALAAPGAAEASRPRMSIGVGVGSFGGRSASSVSIGGSTAVGDAGRDSTLFVDVIDARTGALAWRGWQSVRIEEGGRGTLALTRAVREILAGFPPRER
jgi:hypothetical protein